MRRLFLTTTCLLTTVASLQAAMFDFTTGVPMPPSAFGNSVTLTNDGVTIQVFGFRVANTTSNALPGQVKVWNTGIGLCSQAEGINCGSGPHTVGNQNGIDFLFMRFSVPVLPQAALITAWAKDFDVSFWGGAGAFDTTIEWDLGDLGIQHNSFFAGTASSGSTTRSVSLTGITTPIDWLAFGAYTGHTNDKFKFRTLSVDVPVRTPEPGSLVLLAGGALALVDGIRRRRDRKQ